MDKEFYFFYRLYPDSLFTTTSYRTLSLNTSFSTTNKSQSFAGGYYGIIT